MAGKLGNAAGLAVSIIEAGSEAAHNEVVVPAKARRFTARYKLKVLQDIENLSPSERGAYLRKRGLYTSHIHRWQRQVEEGLLGALAGSKPGRKAKRDYNREQISRLQKEVERLKSKLKQAETIIEVQKKLSEMLGLRTAENPKRDE